jgi:phosphoserine aminotransferase
MNSQKIRLNEDSHLFWSSFDRAFVNSMLTQKFIGKWTDFIHQGHAKVVFHDEFMYRQRSWVNMVCWNGTIIGFRIQPSVAIGCLGAGVLSGKVFKPERGENTLNLL